MGIDAPLRLAHHNLHLFLSCPVALDRCEGRDVANLSHTRTHEGIGKHEFMGQSNLQSLLVSLQSGLIHLQSQRDSHEGGQKEKSFLERSVRCWDWTLLKEKVLILYQMNDRSFIWG